MGAYPTAGVKRVLRFLRLADKGRIARLLERDEGIPESRLRPKLLAELLFELTRLVPRVPLLRRWHPRLHTAVLRLYGRLAARDLDRVGRGAEVFHFLAAYGHASIDRAHELGMVALCDHAIVHPSVIDTLVDNRGRLDRARDGLATQPRDAHWRAKLDDLSRADAVIVNSDFVRESFVAGGWAPDRIHVAYLGVDESFMQGVPSRPRVPDLGPLRLLFAGSVDRRKGVEVLFEAVSEIDEIDWRLTLAGPVAPDIRVAHQRFLADDRVEELGVVLRPRLRELMLSVPVFVFPSFAEGSARVVFEALACGCYVITTPNSGSIVEDGVHGALVAPGETRALSAAIVRAAHDRDRVAKVGTHNAELVAKSYRQAHYGDALAAIYRNVIAAGMRP